MATQNLELKIRVDASQAQPVFNQVVDGLKALGIQHERIYKAIDVDTNKVIYDVKVLDSSVKVLQNTYYQLGDSIKKVVSQNLGMEDVSKALSISSKDITETKNSIAELAQINKDRLEFALKQETEATRLRLAAKKADTIAAYAELEELEKRHQESIRAITEFENLAEAASDKRRIEAKRKDTIAAFEELAAKEKEQADLVQFHLEANYNSRKVMYADLMREMDEADAARAAKEKARAPQAGRDDRGYTPFAMGTVGANRAAAEAPKLNRQQTLQEAEARAFLNRRAKAEQEWANSFNAVVTPAVENNTEAFKKNKEAVEQTGKAHKSMFAHIAEVVGIYTVLNTTINLTKQAFASVIELGIQSQATQANIFGIFGTEQGIKNLQELQSIASTAGQDIKVLEEAYRRYAPSAILAGATQQEVNKSFKDFAEVATVLHLPEDKINSVFLAIDQMYAKGTVQSEEIKKQLGNVLPAAVEVGAKAMGMSSSKFIDAMSKNEIAAKDFVPKFSALYRQIFGGVDDSVFKSVQDMFFANLMRIKNNWTLLARDVYNINQTLMNDVAKVVRDGLVTIRENLSGIGQAVEMAGMLISVRLGVGALEAIVNIRTLATKLGEFSKVLTGLPLPLQAVTAAAGALYLNLNDLSLGYNKTTGFTITFKEQQVSLTSYLKEAGISVIDDLKNAYERLSNVINTLTGIDFGKLWSALIPNREDVKEFGAYMEAMKTLTTIGGPSFAETYEKTLAKFEEQDKARLAASEAKQKDLFDKAAARDKAEAEARAKALTPPEIPAPNLPNIPNEPDKQTDAERKRAATEAYKTALEEAKNASKQIQSDIAEALGNIDVIYQQNGLTIENYFSQKMQLQETDLAVQKEMLNQELQLAYAQKDKVKIAKLNGEIIKAETDANKLATKTIKEKAATVRDYNSLVLEGQAKVLAYQGRGGEAAIAQFDVQTQGKFEKFAIAGDTAALKNLEIERQNVGLKGALADVDERRAMQEADYQNAVERTNILLNTGAIGQLTALQQIEEANKARIESMQEAISLKEQEIAKAEELAGVVDFKERNSLKRLREELDKFKLTSDVVAQHFEKVFSDSFTNAFTGFANGTMTAKQAFASLITSMIGEIQKLIAQEMASAALRSVIRPLANWAMSGLGGIFGGATSVAAGNSAGFASAMEGSNWMTAKLANGGVMSGAGISAYSGSIVSQPTIFPFAKGTGLMGEAGPEAILPLKRNSQGKLGVVAESGGQSNSNVYNIAVTVQSSKDEKPADTGQKIAEAMMRTIAKQEISSASRAGNSLNRTTKFG